MREIKFRAWHKKYEIMAAPFELFTKQSWDFNIFFIDKDGKFSKGQIKFPDPKMVFMQYIGIKDKNGKSIYEGDIVKVTYNWGAGYDTHQVVQETAGWNFYPLAEHAMGWLYHKDDVEFEVIGNIYENPELIK